MRNTIKFRYSALGLYLFKRLFCWAYFQGSLISEGHIIGGNFAFQNGLGLAIKTANSNFPWAYIQEGLLSEGYLNRRFRGLIYRKVYFWEGLLTEFYGIYMYYL